MKSRKLSLRIERLAELRPEEMHGVVGGTHFCETVPPELCLSIQRCFVTHQAECNAPTLLPNTCTC